MHFVIDARMVSQKYFGIASYVSNLVKALAQIDKENKYTILVQNDILSGSIDAGNFNFKFCPIKWLGLQEQWQLPHFLRKLKPDIFHATSFAAPVYKPCKTIVTIHDLIHVIFPEHYGPKQKIYYQFIVKQTLKSASKVIAVSNSTNKDLISYFDIKPEKIKVIHEAAEKKFCPIKVKDMVEDFKRRFSLPANFILYVGNRKEHKNLKSLFKAFEMFKNNDKQNYHLVITGLRDVQMVDLARQFRIGEYLVCIHSLDNEQHLPLLYNCADLFVFPSLYEGFGLPPLEAMACGTPVITSNVSSLPEVVGNAGIMVDPLDTNSLAKAIEKVLSDKVLAKGMSQKGLERAKIFSWEKCARQTLEIYQT